MGSLPYTTCAGHERPVAELPDIDMIGIFEEPNTVEFMKNIDKTIPDVTPQSDSQNIWSEQHALGDHLSWTFDAGRAAMACDGEARVKFYEDLINTLKEDFAAVNEDFIRKLNQNFSRGWNMPLRMDSGQRTAVQLQAQVGRAPWFVTFIRTDHKGEEASHPIQNYSNSEGGRSTSVEFEIIDEITIDNELSINDEIISTDKPKDTTSYEQESSGDYELEEYEVESILDCRSADGAMERQSISSNGKATTMMNAPRSLWTTSSVRNCLLNLSKGELERRR